MATDGELRIALVGDLHDYWTDWDTTYFNASDYDAVIVTGDLGSSADVRRGVRIAKSLARLNRPTFIMPGNNDALVLPEVNAELAVQQGLERLKAPRVPGQPLATDRVRLCGYDLHQITNGSVTISLVAARPFAMGGNELSFPEQLLPYGVQSLEDSERKLFALLDQVSTPSCILLGHNGPKGLGAERSAMWGNDFAAQPADWGDSDLAAALEHAQARDLTVLAVVAGHMHLRTRQGEERPFSQRRGSTLFVNPARVPRILTDSSGEQRHHHVALTVSHKQASAEEVYVPAGDPATGQ